MTTDEIGILYKKYRNYLLSTIQNRLYDGCPYDYMYDCLEEVFETALKKKDDPKFNRDPFGWLVVTTQNVVNNFNRKNLNRLRFQDSRFDFDLHEIPVDTNLLDHIALKLALENNIWDQILSELDSKDRVCLIMHYYQKIPPDEIAKELHMTKTAVKVRLSRLKKKLRDLVYKYVGEN